MFIYLRKEGLYDSMVNDSFSICSYMVCFFNVILTLANMRVTYKFQIFIE